MSIEDKAQEHELALWEQNNRPRNEPVRYAPADAGYGPEECEICEDTMPTERRAWGYQVCVACKSRQEARHARR